LLERPFVFNVSLKLIKTVKLATQCCLQNGRSHIIILKQPLLSYSALYAF